MLDVECVVCAWEVCFNSNMNPKKNTKLLALSSFTLALTALSAHAATTWTGTIDSDIGDAANWSNGLPSSTNLGTIDNGAIVEMESRSDLDGKYITVSGGSTILVPSGINGFRWGASEINLISGGNLDSDYTSSTQMGRNGSPTLNLYSGSTATFASNLNVGREHIATVNQFGGTMLINGTLSVPENARGTANGSTYNLSGGNVTANYLLIDPNSSGTNYFNFTTGSTGSLTIVQGDFDFESFIDDGEIRINDNASSLFTDFKVDSSISGQTTLTVVPEPGTYALFTGVCALSAIMLRRRG